MIVKLWQKMVLSACSLLFATVVQANFSSIPKETYDALKLDKSAAPKELYEALVKRYKDPAQGAGRGSYAQYWEPIAFGKYLYPDISYQPPTSVKEVASREQCVDCHADETPVWVKIWKESTHANLDKLRQLRPDELSLYKKAKLEEIENNRQTRR